MKLMATFKRKLSIDLFANLFPLWTRFLQSITEIKINMRSSSLFSVFLHLASICIQRRMQASLHSIQEQYLFAYCLETLVHKRSLLSRKTVHGSHGFTRINFEIVEIPRNDIWQYIIIIARLAFLFTGII